MFSQSNFPSKSKDDPHENQTNKINGIEFNNQVSTNKIKVKTTFENFLSKIINRKRNFNYFKSLKRKQEASTNCAHEVNFISEANSNQQSARLNNDSSSYLYEEKIKTNGQIKRMKIQENESAEIEYTKVHNTLYKGAPSKKEPNSNIPSKGDINIDLLLSEPSSILLPLLKELMSNQSDYSNINGEQANQEQIENTQFKSKFFQDLICKINNTNDSCHNQPGSAQPSAVDLFETNEITEIKNNSILKTLIESFPDLIEKLDLDEFQNTNHIEDHANDDCDSSTIIHNISDYEEENFHHQESDQSVIVKEADQTFLNHSLNQQADDV
jgi:hypothetical protein